jgi:hypothetical protein
MATSCMPRCYDCLTENVTVKVIDLAGCEHWFCAEDWASEQDFHDKVMQMLTAGDTATIPERKD